MVRRLQSELSQPFVSSALPSLKNRLRDNSHDKTLLRVEAQLMTSKTKMTSRREVRLSQAPGPWALDSQVAFCTFQEEGGR